MNVPSRVRLMPRMDTAAFKVCFNRLAKAKQAKDIDGATIAVYLDTLRALPMWAIEEAAETLRRTTTYGFPTTDVWYQEAEAAMERRLRQSLTDRRVGAPHECAECRDEGWREQQCTPTTRCGRPWCERMGETYTHDYYGPCPCRPTNRTYQRQTRASRSGHGSAGQ